MSKPPEKVWNSTPGAATATVRVALGAEGRDGVSVAEHGACRCANAEAPTGTADTKAGPVIARRIGGGGTHQGGERIGLERMRGQHDYAGLHRVHTVHYVTIKCDLLEESKYPKL